jgi:hypothetical protein
LNSGRKLTMSFLGRALLPLASSKRRSELLEEVMNDIAFSEHVILHLPGTGDRKVATSFEAIECLQNEWPQWARGRRWRSAQSACRDALDGWCGAKAARRSFVKAADRAGLLRGRRRSSTSAWHRPASGEASMLDAGAQ